LRRSSRSLLLARPARRNAHPELGEERGEHLDAVQERVEDQRRLRFFVVELFDQVAAERRLARARLTGHEHEALAVVDAIEQLAFRLAILLRIEDEPWVRRQRERLVGQAVKLLVHSVTVPVGR
jgi:hypothetical protein